MKFSYSQEIWFEDFNSKSSFLGWKINTNGALQHSNHYSINGVEYYKTSLDSFLIVSDTSKTEMLNFGISKKFKLNTTGGNLQFRYKFISLDSTYDILIYGYIILDNHGKTLSEFQYFTQPTYKNNFVINSSAIALPDTKDSIWQNADSIYIYYRFASNDSKMNQERLIVIDGNRMTNYTLSSNIIKSNNFNLFPNPTRNNVFVQVKKPNRLSNIKLYDNLGKLLLSIENLNQNEYTINLAEFESGIYRIVITSQNTIQSKYLIIL